MIIEFTLKNFRSFRKETTLSTEAESLKSNTGKLLDGPQGAACLPSVGIFGGNASGKSNIFKALSFMAWAMRNSDYIESPTTRHSLLSPFRLNEASAKKPISLRIVLWDQEEEKEYTYGFELDNKEIVSEELQVRGRVNKNFSESHIFSRRKQEVDFGGKAAPEMRQLEEKVRPDALALSVFAQFNDQISSRLVELVGNQFLHIDSSPAASMYAALAACEEDEDLLESVTKMVLQADLSIRKISVEKRNAFEGFGSGPEESEITKALRKNMRFTIRKARTSHRQYGGPDQNEVVFDLEKDESVGTGRFFALATHIIRALRSGGVLVIDDLDSNLHPLMSKAIIDQFDNKATNPKGAQLIYNSHETFLMSESVNLRRDQIWLTEKNDEEETELIRLSDYKIRDDYRVERNYMVGRFGAIPDLQFEEPDE